MVIVRFADDAVVGFEHREDAERFWTELRDRLASFGLELAAEKTRLIEFGRFAARDRKQRGLGRPETFRFLGFTHICARSKSGRFKLKRITDSKRLQAKLRSVKAELMRRRHQPIPEQGEWLASASCVGTPTTTGCPTIATRCLPSASSPPSTGTGRCGAAASSTG